MEPYSTWPSVSCYFHPTCVCGSARLQCASEVHATVWVARSCSSITTWWVFGLFPPLGDCEWCCCERSGASIWVLLSVLWGVDLARKLLGSQQFCVQRGKNHQTLLQGLTRFTLPPAISEDSSFFSPHRNLFFSDFSIMAHLVGMKWHLIMVATGTSLICKLVYVASHSCNWFSLCTDGGQLIISCFYKQRHCEHPHNTFFTQIHCYVLTIYP